MDIEDHYRRYGPMVLRRCRCLLQDEQAAQDNRIKNHYFSTFYVKNVRLGSLLLPQEVLQQAREGPKGLWRGSNGPENNCQKTILRGRLCYFT